MTKLSQPLESLAADDDPPPAAYTTTHEHLTDLLARCSDLVAAHVARAPRRSGGRGVSRDELLERSALRSTEDVPDEARELWSIADARLEHIRAREALTAFDLPLRRLQRAFALSEVEVDVLMLAAAPHLDARFVTEWEVVDSKIVRPEVRSLMAVVGRTLEDQIKTRRLFSSDAALFASSLLIAHRNGMNSEGDFLGLDIEVPRRVISELLGDAAVEDTLMAFSALRVPRDRMEDVVLPPGVGDVVGALVKSHDARLRRCTAWGLDEVVTHGRATIVLFAGPPGTGKTMLAHAVAREAGLKVLSVNISRLNEDPCRDLESNLDALFREARLQNALLFFDEAELIFASRKLGNQMMHLLLTRFDAFDGIAILASNLPEMFDEAMHRRIVARVDLPRPGARARAEIWRRHLPAKLPLSGDVDIDRLAQELELTGGTIKNAVLTAVQRCLVRGDEAVTMDDLVHGARLQIRVPVELEHQLHRSTTELDAVVLPAELRARLDRFVGAARVRRTVLGEWGLGRTLGSGHGMVALLSGEPGTGKSMTAEAIAHALDRAVLRCDVTSVISRWVGETATNLERVFEVARQHDAVLVFEEADGLFARRVRVSTATDRAMNSETAALLGMLDRFDGVAILTTNMVDDLDPAFARRIQLRATFHAPDVTLRLAIWRRLLGSEAPVGSDVDLVRLARNFALTGAGIRSAVLSAALEAASSGDRSPRIVHAMLERAAREVLGEHIAEPRAAVGLA